MGAGDFTQYYFHKKSRTATKKPLHLSENYGIMNVIFDAYGSMGSKTALAAAAAQTKEEAFGFFYPTEYLFLEVL